MSFCQNCGQKLNDGARFCPSCGTPVGQTVVNESTAETEKQATATDQDVKNLKVKPFPDFNIGKAFGGLQSLTKNATANVDVDGIKKSAAQAGEVISGKAGEIRNAAMETKADIESKLTELDRMLDAAVTDYNDAYTLMNDKGVKLYVERSRAVDLISYVEVLVNSIANRPKSFEADFEEIETERSQFVNSCDFAAQEIQVAREAAGGAGAGIAAGASVACMAPAAAMWIASTFGTASTGVAISTLSGAAAESAALAWLGGGALAAGGGGTAAGTALLAMAGPVGWTIAGGTLLTSIVLFNKNRAKLNKQKNEEIESVKKNTESVREMDAKIGELLTQTASVQSGLSELYKTCMQTYGKDYTSFDEMQKMSLGNLVNSTKALAALLAKTVANAEEASNG